MVDLPRPGVGEVHPSQIVGESHSVGAAEPAGYFSDAAVKVEAQETAIPSHCPGENSSFRIGYYVIEAVVLRAAPAGYFAQTSVQTEGCNFSILKEQQRSIFLQREAAGDSGTAEDIALSGDRIVGVNNAGRNVQK